MIEVITFIKLENRENCIELHCIEENHLKEKQRLQNIALIFVKKMILPTKLPKRLQWITELSFCYMSKITANDGNHTLSIEKLH